MTDYYKCLNPECGIEFSALPGRKPKFHDNKCYAVMRTSMGTKWCKSQEAVLLRSTKSSGKGRPPSKIPDRDPTSDVISPSNQKVDEVSGKNIIEPQNEDMDIGSIPFDELTLNDIKILMLEMSERIDALKEQLAKTEDMRIELSRYKELVNDFLCCVLDIGAGITPVEPVAPPVEVIPPVPLDPKAGLTKAEYKKLCSAKGCMNEVGKGKAFCSLTCAKSVLTNKNSMMEYQGKLIRGE